jgi:hypothetical protein
MLLFLEHADGVRPPDNLATYEHLDSKLSPERGKHPGKQRVVLACWSCNNQRSIDEQREIARNERWQKSG